MKGKPVILDQMLDVDVARALRDMDYDVLRIAELGMAEAEDDKVLAKAREDGRILITLDEHFGDWAVLPLKKHPGVIRIKANPATTDNILSVLVPFLNHIRDKDLKNTLAIISADRVRWIDTGKL